MWEGERGEIKQKNIKQKKKRGKQEKIAQSLLYLWENTCSVDVI